MLELHHILVGIDFSEPSDAALDYASALAERFGSRLHLLHVVPEPFVYPWGTELATLPLAGVLSESERGARERLDALVPASGPLAGRVVTHTAIGTPVERILDYIETRTVDLVVLGTHGRGMVGHLLLGSVAERIVRRSPVPVLTVHGPKARPGAAPAPAQ